MAVGVALLLDLLPGGGAAGAVHSHSAFSASAAELSVPPALSELPLSSGHLLQYPVKELQPLFSAFGFKNFGLTTLRSFLLYFLPLLESRVLTEEEENILKDAPEKPVDLTSVVTTRRVLERIVVHHVSERTAWKLLKARRKARRGMPIPEYMYSVGRTAFRAHALGVAASWVVQKYN